jgi:ubiquinone/menaquinone biosynthesis C-methylase UbiE
MSSNGADQKIAAANRQYYQKTANTYDKTETCITDKEAQNLLIEDLDRIIALLNKQPNSIRALDACGGSGNAALKLNQRGVQVTACDLSPELLQIYRQRCRSMGFEPKTSCMEIAQFLANTKEQYDLIVFSSALHHLYDIEGILSLAFERLAPKGLLYTVFDPTLTSELHAVTRIAHKLDYYAFKVLRQPRDLPASFIRKLKRLLRAKDNPSSKTQMDLDDENLGVLAEYHVEIGIDDIRLITTLKQLGFEQVWHDRLTGGRYSPTRALTSFLGDHTSFKLLMQKPASTA